MASYFIILGVIFLSVLYISRCFQKVRSMDEGTREMKEMGSIIRAGAVTFMKTEYRTITLVVLVIMVIVSICLEFTAGLTFLMGAVMSSLACVIGMLGATYANVRTANKARETLSIGETVKVALRGGSISGLSVHSFGLLGIVLIAIIWGIDPVASCRGMLGKIEINPSIMRFFSYSLGCSIVAMFNRVAGGNYTKAADISSDILAKIRHDMPEDDSRVPNVIADFIGDNVNDIAGNCSDLLESFAATIVATITAAAAIFIAGGAVDVGLFKASSMYGIVLAGGGLLGCLISLVLASRRKMGKDPSKDLDLTTYSSAGLTLLFGLIGSFLLFSKLPLPEEFRFGWISPFLSALLGIISGVMIGRITEFYTSDSYKPTKSLAKIATEGEAFVITKGDALGSRSCLLPVLVIGISIVFSGLLCGKYGIVISSVGMLSFVGTIVSIDAFGPIADNAGGLAEACHLEENVRKITDKLDSVGNTTAAIGKGFAIGSAAFATVSLIVAYVGNYTAVGTEPILNAASYIVISGAIIGGALIEYFSAMLTDNTIESARLMADEGDRQLSIPGVLEGKVKPDYNKCIEMAAKQALKKMVKPSILALLIPIIGFLFGVEFVGGLLIGATIVAIPRAIFMGNSGGAFDNAKKYIESGRLFGHGKGSDAHKAAVTGDTVGDTRKDVVGVALDIFIKLMSTVANTLAPVFSSFRLF